MAYLEITLQISPDNRSAAAGVYQTFKAPFLSQIAGAKSKQLLVRDEDVQARRGFETVADAKAYLESDLFNQNVVTGLKPLLSAAPEVRIYEAV